MSLFTPVTIGKLVARNRVFMAPLTRCRATVDHIPTDVMATYYAQRASAGLLIAEATMVDANHSGFYREPGIFDQRTVDGWKKVTSAVHAKDGKIFLQIWHGGRAAHSANSGVQPVAPSAIRVSNNQLYPPFNPKGQVLPYDIPRALFDSEIPAIVKSFADGAKRAIEAGFDGVEIHAANGYLLDEFWRKSSNDRPAPYGGSIENRARLILETVDAVSAAIGADRVGIRISPVNSYNSMIDPQPVEITEYLSKQLDSRSIAYLHVMRADFFQAQKGAVLEAARASFKGAVVANMGYTGAEAETAIEKKLVDAVAFGVPFLANPDLPARLKSQAALNAPNQGTFYTNDAAGYTDYPSL